MPEKRPFTRAMIDLGEDDLKLLQKLRMKVGSKVRVVLYGDLVGLSQHAQDDKSEFSMPASGHVELSVSNLKMASNNEIAELLEETDYND
jgi:predicted DNA-binding antitoxin AbrB/MazE fold protein